MRVRLTEQATPDTPVAVRVVRLTETVRQGPAGVMGATAPLYLAQGVLSIDEDAVLGTLPTTVALLDADLTDEIVARSTADVALQGRATALETDVSALETGVATESTARAAGDAALDGRLDTVEAVLPTKADLVGGVVPTSQLPAIALGTSVPVADQAAMLALTAAQVQPGDLAVRADGAGTFMLMAADPSVLANWRRLDAPTDAVTSVNGQVGTVVLSAADLGALTSADLTAEATARANADTALDGRLDAVEADLPTRATAADLTTETTARANADAALDARLDTLEAAPAPSTTFDALTDVDLTGALEGQTVKRGADGIWRPAADDNSGGGGGGATTFDGLTDVDLTGALEGQTVVRGADGIWRPAAGGTGEAGASAYEVWLAQGHVGTEADYLAWTIGPEGPEGPAGAAGPAGLTFRGQWDAAATYVANDLVSYDGSGYFVHTAPPVGTAPLLDINAADPYWELLVLEGARGQAGPAGPSGGGALAGKLSGAHTATTTTLTVILNQEWPTGAVTGRVLVDSELMDVSNIALISGSTYSMTVTRGVLGTTAATHKNNTSVFARQPFGGTGGGGGGGAGGTSTIVLAAAAHTAAAGEMVLADATTAGFTVTLPSAPTLGQEVGVKKVDATANVVTVLDPDGATIEGDPNATIIALNAGAIFQWQGTRWIISGQAHVSYDGADGADGADGTSVPDRRWTLPATGSASIDEFDGAVLLDGWTQVHAAGTETRFAYGQGHGVLAVHQKGGDPGGLMHGLVRPLGASLGVGEGIEIAQRMLGPWAEQHCMSGPALHTSAVHGAGVGVYAMSWRSTLGHYYHDTRLIDAWSAGAETGDIPGLFVTGDWHFSRLVRVAADQWRHDVSAEGVIWLSSPVLTKAFEPTYVGLAQSSWGSGNQAIINYAYIRRVTV